MNTIYKVISAVLSISAICSAAPAVAVTSTPLPYVLKTIFIGSQGDPGDSVFIYDVNDSVQIVGTGALGAFTEKGDDLERFTLSQCPNCQLINLRMNEAGDVAGGVLLTPSQFAGFYHNGPHNRLIKGPAGTRTLFLSSLNNHGETTGSYLDANGKYSLFLEQFGKFTSFSVPFPGVTYQFASGINDAGQIIGGYTDSSGSHGFVYSNGKFSKVEFPFGSNSNASLTAINAHGQIIGIYYDAGGVDHSFLYINGTFSTLSADDFGEMYFTAINDHGDVAGTPWSDRTSIVLHTTDHGFGTAQIQGKSLFPITATVSALNNNGQIVGTYKFHGSRDCDDACPTVGFLLNRILH